MRSKQPAVLTRTCRLKKRSLEPPEGAQRRHMRTTGEAFTLGRMTCRAVATGRGQATCHAAKSATAPGRNGLRHAQSRSTRKLHIKLQHRAFQRHYDVILVKTSLFTNVKALLDEGLCHKPSSSETRLPALQLQQLVIPCSPANPCGSPEGSSPGGPPRGEDLGGANFFERGVMKCHCLLPKV